MNELEVTQFYRQMQVMFRNYTPKFTEADDIKVLSILFGDDTQKEVFGALAVAISEANSNNFAPNFAEIKRIVSVRKAKERADRQFRETHSGLSEDEWNEIESKRKAEREKKENFKRDHCGKSEEEWNALIAWEQSPDGVAKIKGYQQRIMNAVSTYAIRKVDQGGDCNNVKEQ